MFVFFTSSIPTREFSGFARPPQAAKMPCAFFAFAPFAIFMFLCFYKREQQQIDDTGRQHRPYDNNPFSAFPISFTHTHTLSSPSWRLSVLFFHRVLFEFPSTFSLHFPWRSFRFMSVFSLRFYVEPISICGETRAREQE